MGNKIYYLRNTQTNVMYISCQNYTETNTESNPIAEEIGIIHMWDIILLPFA